MQRVIQLPCSSSMHWDRCQRFTQWTPFCCEVPHAQHDWEPMCMKQSAVTSISTLFIIVADPCISFRLWTDETCSWQYCRVHVIAASTAWANPYKWCMYKTMLKLNACLNLYFQLINSLSDCRNGFTKSCIVFLDHFVQLICMLCTADDCNSTSLWRWLTYRNISTISALLRVHLSYANLFKNVEWPTTTITGCFLCSGHIRNRSTLSCGSTTGFKGGRIDVDTQEW